MSDNKYIFLEIECISQATEFLSICSVYKFAGEVHISISGTLEISFNRDNLRTLVTRSTSLTTLLNNKMQELLMGV